VGPYAVRPGHIVYINDTTLFAATTKDTLQTDLSNRHKTIELHISTVDLPSSQPSLQGDAPSPPDVDIVVPAQTANFGADFLEIVKPSPPEPSGPSQYLPLFYDKDNDRGCKPFQGTYPDSAILVHRGTCSFIEKLKHGRDAKASAVMVVSDEDTLITPSTSMEDVHNAGNLNDTSLLLFTHKVGKAVLELLETTEGQGKRQLVVSSNDVPPAPAPSPESEQAGPHFPDAVDPNRILYINGHALLNTRLLV
jgi:ER degradation enhancer, mannosidase alpha-like 1